ncbi:hypothetical protein LZ30DRAFT_819920 [Colletotrichum cereale]|nr:hypothetical protein LZ30DRAFT_819920 [Colletotrichum cereale]
MSAKILSFSYDDQNVTNSAVQDRSFKIDYEHNGFKERRVAMKYETVDFSWDIIHIQYGTETRFNGDDFFKTGNNFFRNSIGVAARLFFSLDSGNSFVVNNDMFGGDPALGDEKRCEVKYIHVEKGGRDYAKDRENFGYWFVSMPEGEETDFGGARASARTF